VRRQTTSLREARPGQDGGQFIAYVRKRYYTEDKMIRRAYAPEDVKRFNDMIDILRRYATSTVLIT
jgi:hypothetical protein